MAGELQTVATYRYPIQAQPAKAQLETQGIECFLADIETVYTNTFLSNAVGGVKVQVYDSDAFRAGLILQNWEKEALRPAEDETRPHCPDCFSQETHRVPFSRPVLAFGLLTLFLYYLIPNPFVLLILVFAVLYALRRQEWKCGQCGRRFHPAK